MAAPRGLSRGQVLGALGSGPSSTGDLAVRFDVSRQAIQYHLSGLETTGLIRRIGTGRATRWYSVVGTGERIPATLHVNAERRGSELDDTAPRPDLRLATAAD